MTKIINICIVIFLVACGSKEEKWICTHPEFNKNTLRINGIDVRLSLSTIRDNGTTYFKKSSYVITDTIYHARNSKFLLYILKNNKTNEYSVLPIQIKDSKTRKYLAYEAQNTTLKSKKELLSHLYDETTIRTNTGEQINIPMFYGFFGHLKNDEKCLFKKE